MKRSGFGRNELKTGRLEDIEVKLGKKIVIILILVLILVTAAACERSHLKIVEENDSLIRVEARNSKAHESVTTGIVEISEDDQLSYTSEFTKGSIRIEIIPYVEGLDIQEAEGITVLLISAESNECKDTYPAGTYIIRAICVESATGSFELRIEPKA